MGVNPWAQEGVLTTTVRSAVRVARRLPGAGLVEAAVDRAAVWARKNSLWPMPFGTACCGIELMATLSSRYDLARFGAEVIRFSPRQSDLMIVSGRIALKMMPVLLQIWNQMPEPKWCIAMGACASCGGIFDNYANVQGVDRFLPVDVYVPGCPPRPESVIDGLLKIQELVEKRQAAIL
jgi:NADH-quinone oxidoreductase subunit B